MMQEGYAPLDDTQLIERIKAGDFEAFETIVSRYQERVFGLALSMLRDEVEAQDVVQETFLNVFRKIDTFRGDSAFSSWLYRIAANNAMMKLRGKRREMQVSVDEGLPRFDGEGHHVVPVEDWTRRVDHRMENLELGSKIREAVDKLPEKYRIVFLLSDVEELSMKEVGEVLGLTVPNVKTRLHRARLFLRAELARYLASQL
jgi:RNA polymerase sigma-70 factor (ECF subfamily)